MTAQATVHSVAIVVPVYRGATTLAGLMRDLLDATMHGLTPCGHSFRITEVLLVHDRGPDESGAVIRALAVSNPLVRPIWLSRNFGQHAATLAGMASSTADWVVTMDEDGQHDPVFIASMLDTAMEQQARVVYAAPTNSPPHGWLRNSTSTVARWVFLRLLSSEGRLPYNSFRLVEGEIARSVAAYGGAGVYLDVALGWVTQDFAACEVELREEGDRPSGYSLRSLSSHFWRLVLTSGTRPMRIMSAVGAVFASIGGFAALAIVIGRITGAIDTEGWASLATVTLVGFGLVLITLGLVAEYVGVTALMAMGKPPYLIVGDQQAGPLGRGLDRDEH